MQTQIMIKIAKYRFLICLMAVLCSGVFSTVIKKEASASSGSVITLQDGKYTRYDITNDGKKDVIQLKKAGAESDWYTSYKVYINGKCALTIKNLYYYSANAQLMRLSNNKSYLFIHLAGDNDDGPSNIYRYKKGKLVKVVDLIKPIDEIMGGHCTAEIKSVKGKKIYVSMNLMSYGLAGMEYEAVYKYKAGNLVSQSKEHRILGYCSYPKHTNLGIYTLTSTRSMQLYKNAALKQKSVKVKAATKMKVKRCYISGKKISFYVETSNGKKGWFKSPKSAREKLFKEIMYAG